MTHEEEAEFDQIKTARDALLIKNARLHGEIDNLKKCAEDEEFGRIEREIKLRQAPPAAPAPVTYSIKLTQGQRVKLMQLGGPKWIRAAIDAASVKK